MTAATTEVKPAGGIQNYYTSKIEEAELAIHARTQNLRRLEAQRNALNTKGECYVIICTLTKYTP